MSERRVLVVEDKPAISDAVAARLRAEGFDVAAALDGLSAVALDWQPFDIESFLKGVVAEVEVNAAAAGRSVRLAMSDCGGDASWSHSGPAMVQRSTR